MCFPVAMLSFADIPIRAEDIRAKLSASCPRFSSSFSLAISIPTRNRFFARHILLQKTKGLPYARR